MSLHIEASAFLPLSYIQYVLQGAMLLQCKIYLFYCTC